MHFVCALALACVLADGDGQEKSFNPAKTFSDWDPCLFSEFSDLYRFDAFKGPADRDPTPAEIEKLKKDWEAEKARVAKEIERIHSDSRARFSWGLRCAMKRDRFLSSIHYETRDGSDLTIFVQDPQREQQNYVKKVEFFYRPYVEALIRHFDAAYAKPLGLVRQEPLPSLALAILSSRGAYVDYMQAQQVGAWPNDLVVAHYDPVLHLAITFEQGTAAEFVPERVQRRRVLHECVHGLTDAYSTKGLTAIGRPWLVEGLAEYLGTYSGEPGNATLHFGEMDRQMIGSVRDVLSVQPIGDVVFPPLADLVAATSYGSVIELATKRAKIHELTLDDHTADVALRAFYDASYLLVQFLENEEGGKWRDGFRQYLKAELKGRGGVAAFRASLGTASLEDLEQSFRRRLDAAVDSSATAPAPTTPVAAAETTPAIRLDVAESTLAVARALARARSGDVAGGLDATRAAGGDADDVAFLEALLKLSSDVLEGARKEDKNLAVKGASGAVGRVKQFDAKQIVLIDYKGKEISIPRWTFGPDQVVERVRSKQLALGTPETLASALVLSGKTVAEATKGPFAAVAASVRARAERWANLDREIEARTRLERLAPLVAATAPPSDATASLADVDALLGGLRAAETSKANQAAIRAIGAGLLAREFDRSDAIVASFHGQPKRLANGALEIRYPLAKPDELADFVEDRKYAWEIVRDDPDSKEPTDTTGKWGIEKGKLVPTGLSSLFHVARFAGPASIEFTMNYAGGAKDEAHPSNVFVLACDDGALSHCLSQGIVGVTVYNSKKNRVRFSEGKHVESVRIGQPYKVSLVHDGAEFVHSVEGSVKHRVADEGVANGRFGLLAIGEFRFEVSNIVIRGMLDPEWIADRRAAWVAERSARWEK